MKRKNVENILIAIIIICALLIISILICVFLNKKPDLPDNVLILPYVDDTEIEIKSI